MKVDRFKDSNFKSGYSIGFGCPFRNNRSANSENDERRGVLNWRCLNGTTEQRGSVTTPKATLTSGEGLVERLCILSTFEVALRPHQYFTSFVCLAFPSTYSTTGIQHISAYLNNTSFVIRVIILIWSCTRK